MFTDNTDDLRPYCGCLLHHLFRDADTQSSTRVEIAATLERVQSARAVQQIASTLTSWAAGLVGDAVGLLDRDLVALGFPTFSSARAQDRRLIPDLIERGRIETRDEYRTVEAFVALEGPLGPSTAQRDRLLELLNGYSESDRESADTAPLALAWRVAARDLNIRFVSPYRLSAPHQPEVWCCGLLPDFGNPIGTVVLGRFASAEAGVLAEHLGHYSSGLNPLYYEYYARSAFEETLNDWGWFATASAPPSWFRGGMSRHGGPEDTA
jgi:hypothetical protein